MHISVATCDKPTINDGSVSPDNATIENDEYYTLTCNDGFALSGSEYITCTDGVLTDPLPSCVEEGMCIYVKIKVIDKVDFKILNHDVPTTSYGTLVKNILGQKNDLCCLLKFISIDNDRGHRSNC